MTSGLGEEAGAQHERVQVQVLRYASAITLDADLCSAPSMPRRSAPPLRGRVLTAPAQSRLQLRDGRLRVLTDDQLLDDRPLCTIP